MKKVITFILITMMVLSLTACGGKTMELGTFNVKLASGWDYKADAITDRQTDIECKDSKGQELILISYVTDIPQENADDEIKSIEAAQGNTSFELTEIGGLAGCKVTYTMDSNNVQTDMTTYVLYDASASTIYYIGFGCSEKVMEDFLAQLSK